VLKHKNIVVLVPVVVLLLVLFSLFRPLVQVSVSAESMVNDTAVNLDQPGGGTIQGSKWHDLNGDGVRDGSEPVVSGWTIFLDTNNNGQLDGGEQSTVTDINGDYSFIGLTTPFSYTVAEVLQPGWQQSYPGGITIPSGNVLVTTGAFFGSTLPSRLY
jgi:hypothetical protein